MVQKKTSGPADAMNGSGKRQATTPYTRGGMNKTQNGSRSTFQTDTSISATGRLGGPRDLQRWDAGGSSGNGLGDGGLEDSSTSKQPWDQFAVNKAKFGVETDYDENIYTTAIDRSRSDYKEREAQADQLARRIESSAATSAHTAEERTMDHVTGPDDGQDEEDKYSGVKRADFPPLSGPASNVYTPPARRAPTGQATVKGAPVDPAIISSQLRGATGEKPTSKPDDVSSTAPKAASSETLPPRAKIESANKDTIKTAESTDKSQLDTKKQENIEALKKFNRTMQDRSNLPPNATSAQGPIEAQVAKAFKDFAHKERHTVREKAEDAKKKKLKELLSFANTFKLGTPVPNDLISIIAKDPKKQLEIQEKAKKNAEEVQRSKEMVAKKTEVVAKDTAPATAKTASSSTKTTETTGASSLASSATTNNTPDSRAAGRGAALPPHVNAAVAGPNRHPGSNRQSYGPGQYQQQYRGDRGPGQNVPRHNQQSAHMAQQLRTTELMRMGQAPLRNPDMRVPPTGPSSGMGPPPAYAPRHPGMPPMGPPRLNPSSVEFKPNAPSFVPTGPSAASSPHSILNNIASAAAPPVGIPQPGPKFRKVRPIDVNMCNTLSGVLSMQPDPAKKSTWEENGLRPPYETQITWKTVQPTEEGKTSWKDQFERPPIPNVMATPTNAPAVPQQMAHQHQLPLYMQQGAQITGPRQSPHIPPIPMHGGHPGHGPHMPFNGDDGARMMHPNPSQQPFASPRPGQAPTAFAPNMMNSPHMPYSQPVMQGYMPGPGPQMSTPQMRYAQSPQYVPQQHGQIGPPMMIGPQGYNMAGPQHMMQGGPQMQQMGYPNPHPNYVPAGPVPPQAMQGANGYPSPGRPAAPIMAHQGSQQGHIYGMSPGGMPFQQPQFQPQPGPMGNMRVNSNPGPQQGHHYGPQQHRGNGYGAKNYAGPHQGPSPAHNGPGGPQARASEAPEESK